MFLEWDIFRQQPFELTRYILENVRTNSSNFIFPTPFNCHTLQLPHFFNVVANSLVTGDMIFRSYILAAYQSREYCNSMALHILQFIPMHQNK